MSALHVTQTSSCAGVATASSCIQPRRLYIASSAQQRRNASATGCPGGIAPTHRRQEQRVTAAQAAAQDQHPLDVQAPVVDEQTNQDDEWVEVGRIGPPHGVRGEMKVQPLTDFPEDRLGNPGPRWLQEPAPKIGRRQAAPPDEVELEWGRMMISKGNEVWLVKLADVDNPEDAALLRGHTLLIPASAREPLEDEDEFYVQDLVGLRVFLQSSGEEVGQVADVFDGTGTHDVLRIQLAPALLARLAGEAGGRGSGDDEDEEQPTDSEAWDPSEPRHVLLPFAKALVPVVDMGQQRMEITPPEGLLELAAPSNRRRERRENRGRRERRRTRPRGQAAVDSGAQSGGGSSEGE